MLSLPLPPLSLPAPLRRLQENKIAQSETTLKGNHQLEGSPSHPLVRLRLWSHRSCCLHTHDRVRRRNRNHHSSVHHSTVCRAPLEGRSESRSLADFAVPKVVSAQHKKTFNVAPSTSLHLQTYPNQGFHLLSLIRELEHPVYALVLNAQLPELFPLLL